MKLFLIKINSNITVGGHPTANLLVQRFRRIKHGYML